MAIVTRDGKRTIAIDSGVGVNISDLASMFGLNYGDFLFNVLADYTNNCNVVTDGDSNRFADASKLPDEQGHGYYQDWADDPDGEYEPDDADVLMWDRTINGQTHTFYFYSAFALADCDDTHRTWASRANKLPLLTHPHVTGISNIRVADRPATSKPYYCGELIYGRKPRWNMWADHCGGAGARVLTTQNLYYCVFNHANNKQELIKWNGYQDAGYEPTFRIDDATHIVINQIKNGNTVLAKLTGGIYSYSGSTSYVNAIRVSDDAFGINVQGTMRTGGLVKGTAADSEFDACMLSAFSSSAMQGTIAHFGVSFSTAAFDNRIVTYNKYGKILTDESKTGSQVLAMLREEDGVTQGHLLLDSEKAGLLAMLNPSSQPICIMRINERGGTGMGALCEFDRIVPITLRTLPITWQDQVVSNKGSVFVLRSNVDDAHKVDYPSASGQGLISGVSFATRMYSGEGYQGFFFKTNANAEKTAYFIFSVISGTTFETATDDKYSYEVKLINPHINSTPLVKGGDVKAIKNYLAGLAQQSLYSQLVNGDLNGSNWTRYTQPSDWSSNPKENKYVYLVPLFALYNSLPVVESSINEYLMDASNTIVTIKITKN